MSIFTPSTLSHGRYTIGELIGHGGMAEVRKGIDTRLGRTVAIKIMRSDLANDDTFLKRFRLEARSIALLNNPNIVSIFDTDEEEIHDPETGNTIRVPYIVMEYITGQSLRDILKTNGALNQRDAGQIMLGMLNALEYSHRMGVIHRDIKPGNIMISEQGAVKVMDFGIARMLDDSAATLTQNQGVVGTAQYLSPEQARGEVVDTRSDLYSAGCVLYEMLTGRPPFTGDSAVAIAYQHVSEVASIPSSVIPSIPPIWDAVCAKAMAKDRTKRYATAAQFRKDVATIVAGGTPDIEGIDVLTAAAVAPGVAGSVQSAQAVGQATGQSAQNLASPATTQTTTLPLEATQSFNPLNDGANTSVANLAMQSPAGFDPHSRAAQRALALEEKSKKRQRAFIISMIVGALMVLGAFGAWWMFGRNTVSMATVPTITQGMSQARAKERIESAGFVFKAEVDTDSIEEAGTFTKQNPAGGTQATKGSTVTVWFSGGPQDTAVPDVAGKSQDEAKKILEDAGFKIGSSSVEDSDTVDKDKVTRTDPASGTTAPKGSTVLLYISSGNSAVPTGLIGRPEADAQKILTDRKFNYEVKRDYSDTVPEGSVMAVSPTEGSSVARGSRITITISKGKEPTPTVTVQPLTYVGMTYSQAKAALEALGLTVRAANPSVAAGDTVNGVYLNDTSTPLTSQSDVPKTSTIILGTV